MPADIILLGAEGLHCEVAALTGESAPVENAVDCRSDVPLEARNLVFASTLVVAGEGWGLVVRTGDSTLIGCIAGAAGAGAKHRRSLLEEEMARLRDAHAAELDNWRRWQVIRSLLTLSRSLLTLY